MRTIAVAMLIAGAALARTSAQTVPAGLADYIFTAPSGWTASYSQGSLVLTGGGASGERCLLVMSPITASSGDLAQDLGQAWAREFAGFEPRATMTFPGPAHVTRGVAAQGWEYVIVKRGVGLRGTPADPLGGSQLFGFLMVVPLGGRVATVAGFSADPLVSACFGSTLGNVWPRFLASLQFRSYRAGPTGVFSRKIVGAWESYGSSIGGGALQQYAFTAAGRYSELITGQRDLSGTATWIGQGTGTGAYTISGNQLTLLSDRGTREVWTLRLEEVSEDGGATWEDRLMLGRSNPMVTSSLCGPFPCGPAEIELQMTRRR